MDKEKRNEIIKELESIMGGENVFTDLVYRMPYRFGCVAEYRINPPDFLPDFVVRPNSTNQVSEILKLANKFKIPVVIWGGGTDVTGANSPVNGGITIDMKSINHITVNKDEQYVTAGAGAILINISKTCEREGFLFRHEIVTQPSATLGGSIATNSFGKRSGRYRNIRQMILGLEAVLPDGKIIRIKPLFKTSDSYDLISLLIGSEGTLGIITDVTLKIIPEPESREFLFYIFNSFEEGFNAGKEIYGNTEPEFFDLVELSFLKYSDSDMSVKFLSEYSKSSIISKYLHAKYGNEKTNTDKILLKAGELMKHIVPFIKYLEDTIEKKECMSILTVGFEGKKDIIKLKIKKANNIAKSYGGSGFDDDKYYENRFSSYHELFREIIPYTGVLDMSEYTSITFDISLPETRILSIKDAIHRIVKKYDKIKLIDIDIFSSPQTMGFDLIAPLNDPEIYSKFFEEIEEEEFKAGGSISFAHGIGTKNIPFLTKELPHENLDAMRAIKKALDPNNILNPGKMGNII